MQTHNSSKLKPKSQVREKNVMQQYCRRQPKHLFNEITIFAAGPNYFVNSASLNYEKVYSETSFGFFSFC